MGIMTNVQEHLDDEYVLLTPFSHQISGHNIVLQYDETTICKLLNSREKFFYETIPDDLYEYLPEYKGTIEVQIKEDEKGLKKFLTHNSCYTHLKSKKQQKSLNDKNIECNNRLTENQSLNELKSLTSLTSFQKKCLSRIKNTNDSVLTFLLLENMVAKYTYPCMLDIKMGTQQHGDDASEQKKKLQTLKCQMTTSSKIGSRLCGMRVYQVNTRKYIFFDKYTGRSLCVDGFKRNLLQFLNNGVKFRIDIIDPIIEKLERLYDIIKSKSAYRFYGSSLLVLYDGYENGSIDDDCDDDTNKKALNVDVRMIDFAHSTHVGYEQDLKIHNGPDEGYLFGLDNLIKIFKEIKNDCIQLENLKNDFNNIDVSNICLNQTLLPPPDPSPSPSIINTNLPTSNVFFA